jgi:hypothetical protein
MERLLKSLKHFKQHWHAYQAATTDPKMPYRHAIGDGLM